MKTKVVILTLITLFTSAMFINAQYTSAQTNIASDYYSINYLTIEKTITFVATEPGKGLKTFTILQTQELNKRVGYSLATDFLSQSITTEYMTSAFLGTQFNFNESNSFILYTNLTGQEFSGAHTEFYNITTEAKNLMAAEKKSGYRQYAYFEPSPLVAERYCDEHGLIYDSIVFENYTYRSRSSSVSSIELFIVNHTAYEEAKGWVEWVAFGLFVLIAWIVIWGTVLGGFESIIQALNPPAPEPPVIYGDNITTIIQIPNVLNDTYAIYLDLCSIGGITPTTQGYQEFLQQTYASMYQWDGPLVTVSTNKTLNYDYQAGGLGSLITTFVADIVSIIFLVIIIIIIVVALILIYRIFKFAMPKKEG